MGEDLKNIPWKVKLWKWLPMSRVDSVGKALNLGVVILETHGAVSCDGTSIDVAKMDK